MIAANVTGLPATSKSTLLVASDILLILGGVVVISALNRTKLISDAIRNGASDFVAKPFMPEQLQQTLNSCLA